MHKFASVMLYLSERERGSSKSHPVATAHFALPLSLPLALPLTCVYAKHNIAVEEEEEEALAAAAEEVRKVFRSVAKSLLVK